MADAWLPIFECRARMRSLLQRLGGRWGLHRLLATVAWLGLLMSLSNSVSAGSHDRVRRSWSTSHGLANDSVNAIVETHDGFLWLGTSSGLSRFDGAEFRNFGLQEGLRSVRIICLAEDRSGVLWIGTSGGGVSRWQNGRIQSYGPSEGFPTGADVLALAADPDGSMWIGTEDGLIRFQNGKFTPVGAGTGLPTRQIAALRCDAAGTLWVSVLLDGLYQRRAGAFHRVEGENAPTGSTYSLGIGPSGSILVGSTAVRELENGAWRRFGEPEGLPAKGVLSMAHSADGSVWAGLRTGGLHVRRGDRFEPYPLGAGFANQSVGAVYVDRADSLWIGTVGRGLHRLTPRVLKHWGAQIGLDDAHVTTVVESADGARWLGVYNRGIHRSGPDGYGVPDALRGENGIWIAYASVATPGGDIWMAGEQAIVRIAPDGSSRKFSDTPVRGEAVRALANDGEVVWAGTYHSALLKCESSGIRLVAPRGTFPGGITSLLPDGPDALWVATSEGLHRWESGKVRSWPLRPGVLTENVRVLHRSADGGLWLGTLGGGLAHFRDGRVTTLTTRHGLNDDVVSQILEDLEGNLWLGTNRGIARLERQQLREFLAGKVSEVQPLIFGRNDGMEHEQCSGGFSPSASRTRDGRLLFGTMDGLVEIDPRDLRRIPREPARVQIEEVRVDHHPREPGHPLRLSPDAQRVEIKYTAPLLRGADWVRFRQMLIGRDDDWVPVGRRRTATFDGLPPGEYIFRVAASDSHGAWVNSAAEVAFTITPAYWQTPWFRGVALITLLAGSAGAAWWRAHRQHRVKIAEMERARRHQADLAHASRVALLGELSASLAHELKQPLAAILSNAQAGLRFLQNGEMDSEEISAILRDIVQSDRRASEIIGRLRAMMKKGEVQLEARNLNADVQQVLTMIGHDLVGRGVVVETELAPTLPPVLGDHIQLQQVLMNLVINGCDAMQSIPAEARRILVRTRLDGDSFVRVSVTDCGQGIPPELIEAIFEPFYSTKGAGLGMGLSICRAIVLAHGGQLWAENNPERGATFHFTVRVETPPAGG